LRAEDFSCDFSVLYEGLGISKVQFFYQKNKNFVSCNFFSVFGYQNPGSESAIRKDAGSISALNQCGSEFFYNPGGRGGGRSQIIQRREIMVLYK
jgi:hypothetical protein